MTKQLTVAMEGVRNALFERDERIDQLEREVRSLKQALDVQRQLASMAARLGRLEVDGGSVIADTRPTNGLHHDG